MKTTGYWIINFGHDACGVANTITFTSCSSSFLSFRLLGERQPFYFLPNLNQGRQLGMAGVCSCHTLATGGNNKMYFSLCLLLRYGNMTGVLHARLRARARHQSCCHTLPFSELTPLGSSYVGAIVKVWDPIVKNLYETSFFPGVLFFSFFPLP